jgi:hypothetical protein
MTVTWKTTGWAQQYRIFRDKIIVGILKKEGWKGEVLGEYNGAMLRFRPTGFWKTGTVISDVEGTRELGMIEYDTWKSIGKVTFQDKEYEWKYESWKQNKWSISHEEEFAKYAVTNVWRGEGSIDIEGIAPELVIIGLFIDDHYKMLGAAMVAMNS